MNPSINLRNNNQSRESETPNNACTRPRTNIRVVMVGVCALSSSFRGLELVPSKWRYLVPPTSNASRWAASRKTYQ